MGVQVNYFGILTSISKESTSRSQSNRPMLTHPLVVIVAAAASAAPTAAAAAAALAILICRILSSTRAILRRVKSALST